MKLGRVLGLLAIVVMLVACRSTKRVLQQPVAERELHQRGASELLGLLVANSKDHPSYYSARADVAVQSANGKRSFRANVRMVRDSAVWLSITPALGIEVARVLLTNDSLKLLDKLHDRYWVGDTAQARLRFGVQPSLALVQDALLGLPIGLDTLEKYRSGRETGLYTLSSRERRKFIRAAEDISQGDTLPHDKDMRERRLERTLRKAEKREMMVYKYWIDPDSMRVQRVLITELARDQQADVRYMQRKTVEGHDIPALVVLSLSTPAQAASGTLQLDRIQFNGPLNLPFRIPEKFTPMD